MTLSVSEKQRLKTRYGTWAVVTGASSGIGLELATRLAEAGINLVLNARRLHELEKLADALSLKFNIKTTVVAADIAKQEGLDILLETTQNLDIGLLVASAGYGTSGFFHESLLADEENMAQLNCHALMVVTHHFSNRFVKRGKGGIILMSSMVAFQGVPFAANYAATKAYVQTLAEGIAVELKPFGVDVLAAAPGPVVSGFGSRADMKMNMTMTPEQIGIPILKALGRNTTILPGFLTKFLVYSLRTVPRWGKVKIMNLIMGGMTAHQRHVA